MTQRAWLGNRERLLYVACTRARDSLVLPRAPRPAAQNSWAKMVDLRHRDLPGIDLSGAGPIGLASDLLNRPIHKRREVFAAEAAAIDAAAPHCSPG